MAEATATEKALSNLVDETAFEKLMTELLSIEDLELRALTHTGINEVGQPVRGAHDGFCRVPASTPPRFVGVAHTITQKAELRRKWLQAEDVAPKGRMRKKEPGDVIKSIKRADELRAKFPGARFRLILTTTRLVDEKLQEDVFVAGDAAGIDIEIWEHSRIVRSLDNTRDGQWLRLKHLHVEAQQLSSNLLHDVCSRTLDGHAAHLLRGTKPSEWTERSANAALARADSRRPTLIAVVGRSGFGKSLLVHQFFMQRHDAGEHGLWIEPEQIMRAQAPQQAVHTVLDLHLRNCHVRDLSELGRIRLLVDDVNRASSPTRVLQRILGWCRLIEDAKLPVLTTLVVPIWSDVWAAAIAAEKNDLKGVEVVDLDAFAPEEGREALVRRLGLNPIDADQLASELNYDPVLIGLVEHKEQRCEDVIDQFVAHAAREVATEKNDLLEEDVHGALDAVAAACLDHRNLNPTWSELSNWLSDRQLRALTGIVKIDRVCMLADKDGDRRLVYRHDRIQDALLSRPIGTLLKSLSGTQSAVTDPYFARVVGRAMEREDVSDEVIGLLLASNPIALFHALRGKQCGRLKPLLRSSCELNLVERSRSSLLFVVESMFIDLDEDLVLELTEGLDVGRMGRLARLRGGCAESGSLYLARIEHLGINNPSFDRALERGMEKRGASLVSGLNRYLRREGLTDRQRFGALTLAGEIASPLLADAAAFCFESALDREYILGPALFAVLRCAPAGLTLPINSMISAFESMHDAGRDSDDDRLAQLTFALAAKPPSESVLQQLVVRATSTGSPSLLSALSKIDEPTVLVPLLRHCGGDSVLNVWIRWTGRGAVPSKSIEALRALWLDRGEMDAVRRAAFQLWAVTADRNCLTNLQSVEPSDPLAADAISLRVRLGDLSVLPQVLPEMRTGGYLGEAEKLWGDELRMVVGEILRTVPVGAINFKSAPDGDVVFAAFMLLMRLPPGAATSLLEEHWERLGGIDKFIHCALFQCTTTGAALARASLDASEDPRAKLKYIGATFGFMTTGKYERLTAAHLRELEPYLDHLDDHAYFSLARFCLDRGLDHWFDAHLERRVSAQARRKHRPNRADIVQHLTELHTLDGFASHAHYWGRRWLELRIARSTVMEALREFLGERPTTSRLLIAADVIRSAGRRADLELLEAHRSQADIEAQAAMDDAAFSVRYQSLT